KRWLLAAFNEQFENYVDSWDEGEGFTNFVFSDVTASMAAAETPELEDWGYGLSPYPGDGALDALNMEERLQVLNHASELLDELKRHFLNLPEDYPADREYRFHELAHFNQESLPSVGFLTPDN